MPTLKGADMVPDTQRGGPEFGRVFIDGRQAPVSPSSSQEMVENSFSSVSWLSVLKARFFRTLILIDRT